MRKRLTIKRVTNGLAGTVGYIPECGVVTLELPWLDNRKRESCIPEGEYIVELGGSSRFKGYYWRFMDVPGRSGILVHPGNKLADSEGCILVGDMVDLDPERGQWYIPGGHSRTGYDKFMDFWGGVTGGRIVVTNWMSREDREVYEYQEKLRVKRDITEVESSRVVDDPVSRIMRNIRK